MHLKRNYILKSILLLSLFLNSCSTLDYIPASTEVISLDFTEYNEKGFYFYYDDYPGEYYPLAMVEVSHTPEMKKVPVEKVGTTDEIFKDYIWVSHMVKAKDLLDLIYKQSTKYDADAIVNFNLTSGEKIVRGKSAIQYKMTGTFIKIIDK